MNLKIAFRNLFRNKLNSMVILISLTIGLACFNLTNFFVYHELKTDSFQKDKDRIYALSCQDPFHRYNKIYYVVDGAPEYMKAHFPQVEDYCRIQKGYFNKLKVNQLVYNKLPNVYEASSNFFEFFTYPLLNGNEKTVLEDKNNMVISEELAHQYFGSSNPIGQTIELIGDTTIVYTVSGIFKKPIENSQFDFDMVHLLKDRDSQCYIRLAPGVTNAQADQLFADHRNDIPSIFSDSTNSYTTDPLLENYLEGNKSFCSCKYRDKNDLMVSGGIGLIVLVIALFNTLGLINNKLVSRTKDTAIRRINGSNLWGIFSSFMAESLILITSAFVLSILLMALVFPLFNQLLSTDLSNNYLFQIQHLWLLMATFILIALVIAIFIVIRIPKAIHANLVKQGKDYSGHIRQFPLFTIFQLAASIVLIVISTTVVKQMKFIDNKPLGINRDAFVISLPNLYRSVNYTFEQKLTNCPFVNDVSVSNSLPFNYAWIMVADYEDNGVKKSYTPVSFSGDKNLVKTLGLHIIEGEGFDNISSCENKYIVNKTFVDLFPGQSLVGHKIPGDDQGQVIGVVDDFIYQDLKHPIPPLMIGCNSNDEYAYVILVDPQPNMQVQAKAQIAQVWKELIPDEPLNVTTISNQFEKQHQENQSFIRLITACAIISILLSMIGLFAISVQNCRDYIKEIGIRKVNGAKIIEIVELLNKTFVQWVMVALIIAIPLAYYFANKWLENYMYKTTLSWWIFLIAGGSAFLIALLTVSWQSYKAATKNPVEALRYE